MFCLCPLILSLTLSFSPMCASSADAVEATQNNDVEIQVPNPAQDKSLGPVNLCDADGIKCEIGDAYQDSETSRIYVIVRGAGSTKYYTQKSNRTYWTYMIRFRDDRWLYFSF